MFEQASRRMDRVERQLERLYHNNAPTVPQYDLHAPPGLSPFWFDDSPVVADNNYLVELHHNTSTANIIPYIDGILHTTVNGSSFFGINFQLETDGAFDQTMTDASDYYNIWGYKAGTTRGASDIFSDNLSSVPTSPPWGNVNQSTDLGVTGLTVDTLGGVGSVLRVTEISNLTSGGVQFSTGTSTSRNVDTWHTFNIRFSTGFITRLLAISAIDSSQLQIMGSPFIGSFTVYAM